MSYLMEKKTFPLISEIRERNDIYKYQKRQAKTIFVEDVTKYLETERINRKIITTVSSSFQVLPNEFR